MTTRAEQVAVIGLGYIGLPTAAILATHGMQVLGVDTNPNVVETINRGFTHIVEPELDALVSGVVSAGRLRAAASPEPSGAFILAVPTPFHDGRRPDLRCIEQAANAIAPLLQKGNLVVLESTSPVGTTGQLAAWLQAARPDLRIPQKRDDAADVHLVYCPERVLPGHILHELVYNDRIIGGMTPACAERAVALYARFVRGQCVTTDPRTAEMTKLTENAYRDVNIAFANELSLICEKFGVNVWDLIDLANRHPRVNILQPGPGVGGHCIAVDPWFIIHAAPEESRLIRAAREVNDHKPAWVVAKVLRHARRFSDPVVACLGLSYKADIDDLRESPAVRIVTELKQSGLAELLVVEPYLRELPACLNGLRMATLEEAVREADILVLLTGHRQFRQVDRGVLAEKIVIDTRGLWR
jgi:UDP-N-acetyl-D-mannosaminuronic acid dehydrogenase